MSSAAALKVLLIEDNRSDARLIEATLRKARTAFEVRWVDRLSKAWEPLETGPVDVVLMDLSLPDNQGVEGVQMLRHRATEVPIVVLTGLGSDKLALEALAIGAQDYLTKDDLKSHDLERAIRYAVQRQKNAAMQELLDKVRASERLLARKNRRLARLYRMAHRFVDNVSHEFRTPLTVIMEYVAMLRDGLTGDLNDQQRRMLDVVSDRADDLNNMVHDMLDVSKLGAGILGMHRRPCDVGEIVARVLPNLEKKASIKGVALNVQVQHELPRVYCDPEKIARVMINLAVNAIKFSGRPGRVDLRITADGSSPEVRVSVSDDGAGIDPKCLKKIFKRFKQCGDPSRGSTKGFGLGLNIARELVVQNFGEMFVESRPGQGSTFSFTIPWNDPLEVTRRYLKGVREASRRLSLLTAEIDDSSGPEAVGDVDAFFHYLLRRDDVLFRAEPARWILLLAAADSEVEKFLERARQTWLETNRNRPHGPLPEPAWCRIGTWPADQQGGGLLRAMRGLLDTAEVSHAC